MQEKNLSIPVMRGKVLGVTVLRGYARLCDLALISKADIYDQKINPTGTQRDLNPKHAKSAYEYIKTSDLGYWPEVFLCVRDLSIMNYSPSETNQDIGILEIDIEKILEDGKISVSRVDGNHRLHYADGTHRGFPAIEKSVSFCIAYDLSREKEIQLFRDINNNQRPMNTSHLDNIQARLTPDERLKREDPALWIAQELGRDKESPLFDLVFEGGKKSTGQIIPLRSLKTGINFMLSRPTKLKDLSDPSAQYKVIRNFFQAVKAWQPQAWIAPRKYLLLRGSGFWAICYIGADVIDKVLSKGKYSKDDMLEVLNSGRNWDWSNKGDFQGLGGQAGALKIREEVFKEFRDDAGPSLKDLWRQIISE